MDGKFGGKMDWGGESGKKWEMGNAVEIWQSGMCKCLTAQVAVTIIIIIRVFKTTGRLFFYLEKGTSQNPEKIFSVKRGLQILLALAHKP